MPVASSRHGCNRHACGQYSRDWSCSRNILINEPGGNPPRGFFLTRLISMSVAGQSQFLQIPYDTWIARTGITGVDSMSLSGVVPIAIKSATQLWVTADSSVVDTSITLFVIYWDERGNPISCNNEAIFFTSLTNSAGKYIPSTWSGDGGVNAKNGPFIRFSLALASGFNILVVTANLVGGAPIFTTS